MTAIYFSHEVSPLQAQASIALKYVPALRLDGYALKGPSSADHRLRYAAVSVGLHAVGLAAMVLTPLFMESPLPEPAGGVRAFFAEPGIIAPPPQPPPPPSVAPRPVAPKALPQAPSAEVFVAPVEVPNQIARPSASLGEGGVAGGVEGGVEGGVAGGIVGGLPMAPPPKVEAQVVRVGGEIRAPKRIEYVAPEYPLIASQAGLTGMVIMEAHVGTDGRVKDITVLRSHPLFDEAAKAAVLRWRYQPLLLNGITMEFVLSVTVQFSLRPPQ